MRVTVVGCGRWGSFLAWYADRLGHQATLFGREGSPHMRVFRETRANGLVTLPQRVALTGALTGGADLYLISIGSQGLRAFLQEHLDTLRGTPLVLCMKGLEIGTGERLTEIEIQWFRTSAAGTQEHYFTTKLEDAIIVDIKDYMHNCQDPSNSHFTHLEDVEFTYRKITWTHEVSGTSGSDDWRSPVAG